MSDSLQPHGQQHARLPCSPLSQSLLKFMSVKSEMLSNHLILCHPLPILPSIFATIRILSNELALHMRWAKNWSFRFSISPSNEYSGLISFRSDWFDLLAVQGTLESLLQHHSLQTSILLTQPSLWSACVHMDAISVRLGFLTSGHHGRVRLLAWLQRRKSVVPANKTELHHIL